MTFNPVSYFAGMGTVFVAVAVGFGGGLLVTSSDHKVDPPNRLERIAASAPPATPPIAAPAAAPAQPNAPAAQAEVNPPSAVTPVVAKAAEPTPPVPATTAGQQVAPPQSPPAETPRAQNETSRAQNQQGASGDQPASVREAFAKSRDPDVDVRRRSDRAERRQAERERRKWKWMDRKRRQQDLDGAAEEVRHIDQSDGDREVVQREVGQKDIIELPRLNFFGQE